MRLCSVTIVEGMWLVASIDGVHADLPRARPRSKPDFAAIRRAHFWGFCRLPQSNSRIHYYQAAGGSL